MGTLAAVGYALTAFLLLAAGAGLLSRGSMDIVPLYDAERATDPFALARVVALSLAAFGVLTLAFAVLEALDETTETVVAAYAVGVMAVAVITAGFTRKYE